MSDQETESEEIHVVLGEAGEPQVAFDDRDRAEALRDHWREGSPRIHATVEDVELRRTPDDEGQTIEEEWEANNEPFNYEPPEKPPEQWGSEDYTELFDRYISRSTDWICQKCSQPHGTLRKARSHVRKQHQTTLIDIAVARADYDQEDDVAADGGLSFDQELAARRENNSKLTEFEDE